MNTRDFFPLNDIQVLDICRNYPDAKFFPIPSSSIFARNRGENEFIYSHAVSKFQNLIRIDE